MRQRLLPKQLPAFLARLRKGKVLAIASNYVSVRVTEEPRARFASETTVEHVSHKSAGSSPVILADPSAPEATTSSPVKKYEIGSGEYKVNVRIYKEPPINKL
jgi:hypothetical protein